MGIVLGTEAVIGIVEAAEAAGTAAEVGGEITGEAAGDAIASGTETGAEAGTEAGETTSGAVEAGGDSLADAVANIDKFVKKLVDMVNEYIQIDFIFKTAKKILEAITSDPAAQARAKKLGKLIDVLNQSSTLLGNISSWLKKNADDTTNINDIVVPLRGVLSKFIPKLGAAAGVLKKLSIQVSATNKKKLPITDASVAALETGLQAIVGSFSELADFKHQYVSKVPLLSGLPITEQQVAALKNEMP